MDCDKVVCHCMDVTNGAIKNAYDEGADTLEKIQDATGAGTVCGSCIDDVQHLIDQFDADAQADPLPESSRPRKDGPGGD